MAWENRIPPFPAAFSRLPNAVRPGAEAAWTAAHTLLNAIDAWENWWNLARVEYLANGAYDVATGDEISRVGATAIRTLCGLSLRQDQFSGEGEHLLQHWPEAPSNLVDATWYVWLVEGEVKKTIDRQLFHSRHVLQPGVRELLDVLVASPETALDATASKVISEFAADRRTSRKVQNKSRLATAMMLVEEHPDWSDRHIARQVGYKNHSALSRNKIYQRAAAMARRQKEQLPRGAKDAETGSVEAWEEADEVN